MRDKLIELIKSRQDPCASGDCPFENDDVSPCGMCVEESLADHLIAHGVTLATDTDVGDKKPLTIAERADLERIRISIERKCLDMAQPGMWERYTKNMECGEIREFAQYYRDMELVYKLITGYELPWPPKEVE